MGREIRRVPANYKHPRNLEGHPVPMHNRTFAAACTEWKSEYDAWERGERPSYFTAADHPSDLQYWEYSGDPPRDRENYRPWCDDEGTWFQVWETVSEGTPITPAFASKDELAAHLATKGTQWDKGGWGIAKAQAFVDDGWAPSMAMIGGRLLRAEDVPLALKELPHDR